MAGPVRRFPRKGTVMTEQNLPDEELTVVGDNPGTPDDGIDGVDAGTLDDDLNATPDQYPQAAENNPDNWDEDPLIRGEQGANDAGLPESDQELRDETERERYRQGEEQVPPDEPTIGEAAEDVDFPQTGDPDADAVDASDDPANMGGSPLSEFEPDDLDR